MKIKKAAKNCTKDQACPYPGLVALIILILVPIKEVIKKTPTQTFIFVTIDNNIQFEIRQI